MDYRPHKIAEPNLLKDSVPAVHKSISAGGSDRRQKKKKLQENVECEADNSLLPTVLHLQSHF